MVTQWRESSRTLALSFNQLQAGLEVDMTIHSIITLLLITDTTFGGLLIVGGTEHKNIYNYLDQDLNKWAYILHVSYAFKVQFISKSSRIYETKS